LVKAMQTLSAQTVYKLIGAALLKPQGSTHKWDAGKFPSGFDYEDKE